MNASGAKLVFDNFEKKLKGSIFDFVLYLVQILIWYVSPLLIFFFEFFKNFRVRVFIYIYLESTVFVFIFILIF